MRVVERAGRAGEAAIRIAVIGAGAAGLAASWTLARAGASVVLLEREAEVGGLLRTAERGGVLADQAVQLISSTYHEMFRLTKEAGLAGQLVPASGHDAVWRRGRAHGITYGSVASMVASGAMPTMLKLKLGAKYVPWLTTRAARLDVNDLAGTAVGEDTESIAAWGLRELGDDFVEYLTYPLLAAYYGTPPEETSAALYHALARVGMDVRVFALRGGAGAYARSLAAAIAAERAEIRTGSEVEEVLSHADGVEVRTSEGVERYDGAVVCAPPARAAGMIGHEPTVSWLRAVRTRPAVSVTLWLRQKVPVDWFGISFPRLEPPGDVVVAACVQGRKLAFATGARGDAVVAFPAPAFLDTNPSDQQLVTVVTGAMERALPGVGKAVDAAEVVRLEGGYRKFPPGYIRRLAHDPPPVPAGVHLAGDYLVAPTVEGAVRSGVRAAQRILTPR